MVVLSSKNSQTKMSMTILRYLAVTTIVGFMVSCDGQPMMRKRILSSVTKTEDPNTVDSATREHQSRRGLGRTWGKQKEGKHFKVNNAVHYKGDTKSSKKEKAYKGMKLETRREENDHKKEKFWNDLVDISMSMPTSPVQRPSAPAPSPSNPTNVPRPVANPTNVPRPVANPTNVPRPVSTPTKAPTPQPTLSAPVSAPVSAIPECESLSREEAFKTIIGRVTDVSVLEDSSSLQGRAFFWIVNRDPAQVDPCNYDTVEQRYALATFYYSTNGDDWINSDGWIMGSNECTWYGIGCGGNGLVRELGIDGTLIANDLSGVLPEEIKVFESLEVIEVGQNMIEGRIPDVLTELTQLRIFDVEINSLSGPAIVNLKGLDKLESYRISANRFSGKIDPAIGDVPSLRELWIADNQITGSIPETLGNLVNLETLYLYRNNLVGSLPTTVGQLKKLKELQIFQNFLSGTIPEGLYGSTELGLMRLDRNQFTGTISESIGNLVKLGDLRIDENLFTGKLPASFMNLSRLVVLRLNDNSFVGTIRDEFDSWESLDFADFRNNGFDGTLPSTIFDIPTLRILYFANNNLEGTLPASYGNSPVLRDLFLSGNQLSGTIPDIQVGQLTKLTELLLEDNQFTGSMSQSICGLRQAGQGMLEDLWVDCGLAANPRMECEVPGCCTACFPTLP